MSFTISEACDATIHHATDISSRSPRPATTRPGWVRLHCRGLAKQLATWDMEVSNGDPQKWMAKKRKIPWTWDDKTVTTGYPHDLGNLHMLGMLATSAGDGYFMPCPSHVPSFCLPQDPPLAVNPRGVMVYQCLPPLKKLPIKSFRLRAQFSDAPLNHKKKSARYPIFYLHEIVPPLHPHDGWESARSKIHEIQWKHPPAPPFLRTRTVSLSWPTGSEPTIAWWDPNGWGTTFWGI